MDWWLSGAGIVVGIAGLAAVWGGRQMSTGHAIVVAAGAALFATPHVANIEWSENGLSLRFRDAAVTLTDKVTSIAQGQKNDAQALQDLTAQLAALAREVDLLRKQAATTSGQTSVLPEYDLGVLQKWGDRSREAIIKREDTINGLELFRDAINTGKPLGTWSRPSTIQPE